MTKKQIDLSLVDSVKNGKAVLFLGAGASVGAKSDAGQSIPLGNELKTLITKKFLGGGFDELDFKTIYDFACSKASVREVQFFLYETLRSYGPAPQHMLLPKFVWAGILTTNYDLVVERAYESADNSLQDLVPISRDTESAKEPPPAGEGKLHFIKLHGCVTDYQIVTPPLIASTEQIIHYRQGRSGQFAQFMEWARTKTVVFVGYAMGDSNLRTLFDEIVREGDTRPRHYIVRPQFPDVELKYWADRRVDACVMNFEDFLRNLDAAIPDNQRVLALHPATASTSSFNRFIAKAGRTESKLLREFLRNDCEHVSPETRSGGGEPGKFFEGFNLGWFPIERTLDVVRRINSAIIEEQIIPTVGIKQPQFALLKAHAGAGKSVAIRRVAWDTAKKYERLAFHVPNPIALSALAFEEIVSLTNQTIYLFIDDIADGADEFECFYRHARKKNWPLVVLGGARVNEWNTRCEALHSLIDEEYELKYLTSTEIDELLRKLAANNALGFLATLPEDQRKRRLEDQYGRQLLVALHEATKNKSFRDIIRDEYQSVFPPEAQLLYLDVCSLHRMGPPVRAGLIGRVHGIPFEEFQEKFLLPLEQVIDVKRDPLVGDWVYRARHNYIAQIVYEEVLTSAADKFDNIVRVIGKLNPTFSYDREVISQITKASTLATEFTERKFGEEIYDKAMNALGAEPYLLHQKGVYLVRLAKDPQTLDEAESCILDALDAEPDNLTFKHTLAEIAFKRSALAEDQAERSAWRARADNISKAIAKTAKSSHAHHTLIKSAIANVKDALGNAETSDDEVTQEVFGQAVKLAEERLRTALQAFPNEPYLLNAEAELSTLLKNADRALKALQKAFEKNSKSELIALRYARVLSAQSQYAFAIEALGKALEFNPGSYNLHYAMAHAIRNSAQDADITQADLLLYHFQRSFAKGDKNYAAQFWYARQLCICGQQGLARPYFETFKKIQVPYQQKKSARGRIRTPNGLAAEIHGVIYSLAASYGFIRADLSSMEVYFEFSQEAEELEALRIGDRVSFKLAFTLAGPRASNVKPV
jgi:tetratricopeptide (TPR) repeat protein